MAADHLLSRGFRRFGYMGYLRDIDSERQFQDFSEVVRGKVFSCSLHRVNRNCQNGDAATWEEFTAGLARWIDTWELPVGVFVAHDIFCRFLMDVCRAKGLHVSEDVAIIGTHNETEICGALLLSLTVPLPPSPK